MNRPLLASLSALLLFLSPAAYAQVEPQTRTITTTGDAEIRVVPDEVLISLAVETRDADLLRATQANDTAVGKLIAYVTGELGLAAEHVQTDSIGIEPTYRQCHYDDEMRGACSPLEIVYYGVRKGIQIRLKKPEIYEPLITKALQLGVTHIDQVQFATSELRKHRDDARVMAAKAAKQKAQAIAETLGMTLSRPVTIHAGDVSVFYGYNAGGRGNRAMMAQNVLQESGGGEGAGTTFALGQISVTANVSVTFEME